MNTGIYSIESPSGRRYIGSAINIDRRWTRHLKDLGIGKHPNRSLQRAADKYGIGELIFTKLIICRPDDLIFYEQIAFDGLKPEYNLAPIAGSSKGIRRSDEFRAKISVALRKRMVSAETRAKIGAKHKGKSLKRHQIEAFREWCARNPLTIEQRRELAKALQTPESRANHSKAMMGHEVSAQTREKIRSSLMGHPVLPETRAKLSVRNKGSRNHHSIETRLTEQQKLSICDRYRNGATLKELGIEYNACQRHVKRLLESFDVQIRLPRCWSGPTLASLNQKSI